MLTAHEYGIWQKHNAEQHKRVCACTDVDYAAHNWDNGAVTTPPSHTSVGTKTYTCTDCAEQKTEDIAKITDHTYGAWVTVKKAEIGIEGARVKVCACGDTVQESIPALQAPQAPTQEPADEGNSSAEEGKSPQTGLIIGMICGGAALLLGIGAIVYFVIIRKKKFSVK